MIVFHWSLGDSMSPQVPRTLLSMLADLYNAVFWMLSTRPLMSKCFSLFTNPLGIVLCAPITICITVTYMFDSFFFCSLVRSWY